MAEITGTVRCIRVAEGAGFTAIQDAVTGETEAFILWFGTSIPDELTAFTRVLHSQWVSLLREAHTHNQTVTVVHPDGSAEVTALQVGTI
jgi:hypothetical protein